MTTTAWTIDYAHDALGALARLTYSSGVQVDYAPNTLGQPTQAGTYATVLPQWRDEAVQLRQRCGPPVRLRQPVAGGGEREDYYYDAHGRRVQANKLGTQGIVSHYSQAGQLLYQQDYRQAVRSEYLYLGGSLVAVRETPHGTGTPVVKYQHTDALGTPVAMTDAAKGVSQGGEYEPYGRLVNRVLTEGPGYTGHVQDAATWLTYMSTVRKVDILHSGTVTLDKILGEPGGKWPLVFKHIIEKSS